MIRCMFAGLLFGMATPALAKDPLPQNVTLRADKTVDKVDWSFAPSTAVDFAKLKRCAAIMLKNDSIQVRDGAGSFVGPYSGTLYQAQNSATIGGGSVFKMVDDENKFLVAQGWIDKPVFGFKWIIRFDLELALDGANVKMVMRNLQLAMTNTGATANDGFQPLGSWYRFKQNYATLEASAQSLRSCISE